MKFDRARRRFPETHWTLLDELEKIVEHLNVSTKREASFNVVSPSLNDYNEYIDFAIALYIDKFHHLYNSLANAIEGESYIIYALCGRSIIENAATLRYYSRSRTLQEFYQRRKSGNWKSEDFKEAFLEIDKFVRGSRFSWRAFTEGRFNELSKTPDEKRLEQTNVTTCLNHWYKDTKNLESLYNLFCDLVHPSYGSNMLVMKADQGRLKACGSDNYNCCLFIIAPTLAGIIGVYKEVQNAVLSLEAVRIQN